MARIMKPFLKHIPGITFISLQMTYQGEQFLKISTLRKLKDGK
jgi:hypothetical protein